MPDFSQFPQQLVNGLTVGAIYALIALGYSMVYGILGLLNFAHGDIYMVGAFVGFAVLNALAPGNVLMVAAPIALILLLLITMLVTGVVGVAVESVAYRPLRTAPRIAPLISALGVSFFIQNAMLLTQGSSFRTYKTQLLFPPDLAFEFAGARLSATRALVIVVALLLMVTLTYLVQRTRLGRAMRAVSIDREAAAMMGVDVDRVIALTFFIGSALAGGAGVLVGLIPQQVWHVMGFTAGLKGFTAAVIGGIGNIPGAMLGGLLLGLVETFAVAYIENGSTYRDAITFVVLVAVLLLRPGGLLGIRAPQKV